MALPLFTRAKHDDGTFVHMAPRDRRATTDHHAHDSTARCGVDATGRMPDRAPAAGEQYRFHVDMTACIGCKCCVVACNEQNGNPASINWRRVGEVEGGRYPATQRAYFSMGCNHCTNPTCLEGCPVDAYSKDAVSGIVRHSADTCIGCQSCTWTCSYGVPQFNPERGVVGKCDMCHGRLAEGQAPACVSACPEGAIAIEIVNVADWRAAVHAAAAGMGLPADDGSISTTRVTMPPALPRDARPLDLPRVAAADPHWPLVGMTVLTQLSVGAFAGIWAVAMFGSAVHLGVAAVCALAVAGLALAASTAHLGRPIHAYRALKMWRRSWLSREVLLFGAFSLVSALFAAVLWFDWPGAVTLGALTVGLGIAGVTASGRIYQVRSRPSWNGPGTIVQFMLTSVLLGALFSGAAGVGAAEVFRAIAVAAGASSMVLLGVTYRRMHTASSIELRGSAHLISTTLRPVTLLRVALLLCGGVVLPAISGHASVLILAVVLATLGELAGRYLFFVCAVPKHMTTPYMAMGSEAA